MRPHRNTDAPADKSSISATPPDGPKTKKPRFSFEAGPPSVVV